jgi:hypothetical protein
MMRYNQIEVCSSALQISRLNHSVLALIFVLAAVSVYHATPALAFSFSEPSSGSARPCYLPTTENEIIREASASISRAFVEDGINRQTIRLPLSYLMYSDKEEGFVADRAIGWQGGPQETRRFLEPLASQVLKKVQTTTLEKADSGLPPKIQEQILLDFDGSSLLTAENPAGALYDIQALLQPNTDSYYLKTIQAIEDQFSDTPGKAKRLFLLINPSWRDKSSWGIFDGAKAQKQILDRYPVTFAIDQFIMQGQKLNLLKTWPGDWSVFWTRIDYQKSGKDQPSPQLLGTFSERRPEYWEMERLLKEALKTSSNS